MVRNPWLLWTGCAALLTNVSAAQVTERVSVDSAGAQGNGQAWFGFVSGDGRYVAFSSDSSNLVPGDVNASADVFVRDRPTGTTELVSTDSAGTEGNGNSDLWAISPDGRFVVFESAATNLVAGDTNGASDVFVRDRTAGTTERVSLSSGGVQGNGRSGDGSITPDGRYVAFSSDATNLVPGDTNGSTDVFLRDRQLGTTQRVSLSSAGVQGNSLSQRPTVSADGRFVAFESFASNLVSPDSNGLVDIFVRDRQLGTTVRVSQTSDAGAQGGSTGCTISADGRYVAFTRNDNTGNRWDVCVHDAQTGAIDTLTYQDQFGNSFFFSNGISADGRYVVFTSFASYAVPDDTNGVQDVFVRDRLLDTTVRVSVDTNGAQGDQQSDAGAISGDGRYATFASEATNLVPSDTNAHRDVFVRDLQPADATPFCFGDGTGAPCPCGNSGKPFHGCTNSGDHPIGGAVLTASGSKSLGNDTLRMTSFGESTSTTANPLSAFFQGDTSVAPQTFGDGLRCAGGTMKRLYFRNASGGVVRAPVGAEPSFSARSAALGDVIPIGGTRYYQVQYRDKAAWFCPNPPGNSWNVSSALSVTWDP